MQQISLVLLVLGVVALVHRSAANECLIYSDEYYNRYLYAANDFISMSKRLTSDRYTFAWQESIFSRRNQNEFTDRDQSSVWELVSIDPMNNLYYIRNFKFAEDHLYASKIKYDYFTSNKRRRVFTRKPPSVFGSEFIREQFIWKLIKVGNAYDGKYYIYNLYFNEPLYVASSYYNHDKVRRNLFTYGSVPDSRQFIFVISCRDGLFAA